MNTLPENPHNQNVPEDITFSAMKTTQELQDMLDAATPIEGFDAGERDAWDSEREDHICTPNPYKEATDE